MSGEGSGGGIGSALGTAAALALAGPTGGASLWAVPLIGGAGGAAGGALGSALTGGNIEKSALAGGIGGAIPGIGQASGLTSGLASSIGAEGANGLVQALGGAASGGISGGNAQSALLGGLAGGASGYFGTPSGLETTNTIPAIAAPVSASVDIGSPSFSSKAINWIGDNPTKALALGGLGLSSLGNAIGSPKVENSQPNIGKPQNYSVQSETTPYQGDWYTYGERGNAPQITNNNVRQYAKGGQINPFSAMRPQKSKVSGNPFMGHGQVGGIGGGQDDLVPARLSKDEFVLPADVVSKLGDGSSNAGAEKLHGMINNVRKHKATKKFPPKSKSPFSYLREA